MIETVPELPSTNAALLARLGAEGRPPEGDWLVADRQSAGRGRAGRKWSDGAGNFMGSTVAWLRAGDPMAPTLALVAGLAVHRAVSEAAPGLDGLSLKWPNDLQADGAKLAGILLERQGDAVVVGIGVNLANAPELPDRRTASLAALGHKVSRDAFAGVLAAHLGSLLERWHSGEWPSLRSDWLARAHPEGTALMVRDADGEPIAGTFAGIDAQGLALLRLADGTVRAIAAGDVEMVGQDAARD
ncbi:MAG: biotin--[acetyl-CoA-carboxylase] ligase [Sphingomonadales bacterium]|nr:biotin--[acetyl-CoA-carboxylase] ligase [Sphingomonadales bacterium]MDE2568884.1 biotin--[acetyl-CoA-carboxylase] ligase [Sphingomonadales bacterium]